MGLNKYIVTIKGFEKLSSVAGKKKMMEYLGIFFEQNIYYGKNHCPVQVLRNCVHPLVGKRIFDCAFPLENNVETVDNEYGK